MNRKIAEIKDFVAPIYASLAVGLGHYLLYFLDSILVKKISFGDTIEPLISGGFLFVAMIFYSWYFISILMTPLFFIVIQRHRGKKISLRTLIINSVLSVPIAFTIIIFFLSLHELMQLVIGKSWSI